MTKKIAIVSGFGTYLDIVAHGLRETGHQVLEILITPETNGNAAEEISAFGPDFVLLDDTFPNQRISGGDIARGVGLPREKFIGIVPGRQDYCGLVLDGNNVPHIGTVPIELLKILT